MACPRAHGAPRSSIRRVLELAATATLLLDSLPQAHADLASTAAMCAFVAEDTLKNQAANNALVSGGGCDVAGAEEFHVCDLIATTSTCAAVPGCIRLGSFSRSFACTPENTDIACCVEEVSKPCATCEPVTNSCTEVCVGESTATDDTESPSVPTTGTPSTAEGEFEGHYSAPFSPATAAIATFTDSQCAELSANQLEAYIIAHPSIFPTSCEDADAHVTCASEGFAGYCSANSGCASVGTTIFESCATLPAEYNCCLSFLNKPCATCQPVTDSCAQICNVPGYTTATIMPVHARGPGSASGGFAPPREDTQASGADGRVAGATLGDEPSGAAGGGVCGRCAALAVVAAAVLAMLAP